MDAKYLPTTDEGKLIHLIEECGETIQAATKVLRFGLEGEWNGKSNAESLVDELKDLTHASAAVISAIEEAVKDGSTPATGQETWAFGPTFGWPLRDSLRARSGLTDM